MWQTSKRQIVTILKKSNCDKTLKIKLWQNSKLKIWTNSKAQVVRPELRSYLGWENSVTSCTISSGEGFFWEGKGPIIPSHRNVSSSYTWLFCLGHNPGSKVRCLLAELEVVMLEEARRNKVTTAIWKKRNYFRFQICQDLSWVKGNHIDI